MQAGHQIAAAKAAGTNKRAKSNEPVAKLAKPAQ
jgi:hypothetical protein